MRTQSVHTNLTCNQNCVYCTARRSTEDPAFVRASAVRDRIEAAVSDGAKEIVFTGGEPTLRRDLAGIVAYTRKRGTERLVLETNATVIDDVLAASLRDAGLSLARVNLSAWGDALDAITRDPGGHARTGAGIRALLAAGIEVEIAIAVVKPTLASLATLPAHLDKLRTPTNRIRGIVVRVPVDGPDPSVLATLGEAAEAIVALDRAAQEREMLVRISPDAPIPPCVFPPKSRVTHLFSITRGVHSRDGYRQLEPCVGCQVADGCIGLADEYLARNAPPVMTPVRDERTRRRLAVISSIPEQMRREFISPNRDSHSALGVVEEEIIRVQFQCNQSCRFCFVSTHLPGMGDDAVRAAITDAGRRGVKITLSGGEPTLNARLVEYVALATSVSPKHRVQLQTNAIRLDDRAYVDRLAEARLGEAFVSLHGTTAEVSDAVTDAPGTFVRTIAGLDNLHASPIELIVNFVICETNLHQLVSMVRLVGERWPGAQLSISFVAPSSDLVPRDRAFIPRYTDALPHIAEAVAEAARRKVPLSGFESMCGIPLCLVPSSLERYFALDEVPPGFDGGEFAKTDTCRSCALERRCYGVRVGYRALYGDGELRAVARPAQ
jgi:MoaA/NifB/PqqE/SkfB family radical SAM enzyme